MSLISSKVSPRIAGIIVLVVGFVYALGGAIMKREREKRELSGITVPGTVLRGWVESKRRGRKGHHLEATYRAEGAVRKKSFDVHKAYYFEHLNEAEKVVHADVQVRYQRSSPLNAALVGTDNGSDSSIWVGLIGMGAGAVVLAYAALRKRVSAKGPIAL